MAHVSGHDDHDLRRDTRPRSFGRRLVESLLGLQCKATGVVVLLTLSVATAVAGYLLHTSEVLVRGQHHAKLTQMAALVARAASAPMDAGDPDRLAALADETANGEPLIYVIFSDASGRQLAVAEHAKASVLRRLGGRTEAHVPVPGQPVFRSGSPSAPVFLDVTYPITIRTAASDRPAARGPAQPTRLLGYVRTGMVAHDWHRTMATKLDMMVGVAILVALAAVPLGFFLVRRIVVPLEGLAGAMDRFSSGNLDVRSRVRRRDEIGRLAEAFNRMADQHQSTHERIVGLNTELEKRVALRTQQLRELASREPLTGLYNRRHFNEVLERAFSEAVRYDLELSCIMIDLDGFKAVNDNFGHHVGDELLVLTASTISSQLRTADVAARFGGDEFIVLLPQTDAEDARILAERITERFLRQAAERLPDVRTSMSMGIASIATAAVERPELLIRAADVALYEAKGGGKNRLVIHRRRAAASNPTAI